MSTTKVNCELQLFELSAGLSGELAQMPTVCLLAVDTLSSRLDLSAMADRLVRAGCRYFMTWGAAADELHDALDNVLEDRGGDSLATVTASHKGEPAEDVAWFMANAAVPGERKLRCCVGYDETAANVGELLKAVRAIARVVPSD
jgi:hypothetical protein